MQFATKVINFLRLPGYPTELSDANSQEWTDFHEHTLRKNPVFGKVIEDIQINLLQLIEQYAHGLRTNRILEIGAGVIPMNQMSKDVISSEFGDSRRIDLRLSAYEPPFRKSVFRAVVAQNVFHHLFDYKRSLIEMADLLVDDGILILVEPYHGWLSRLIFPVLFSTEDYDLDADLDKYFDCIKTNQALSSLVFVKNRDRFRSEFPQLKVMVMLPMRSGIRYLASGGLNFRRLLPIGIFKILSRIEKSPIGKIFEGPLSVHWVIVLQKQRLN